MPSHTDGVTQHNNVSVDLTSGLCTRLTAQTHGLLMFRLLQLPLSNREGSSVSYDDFVVSTSKKNKF